MSTTDNQTIQPTKKGSFLQENNKSLLFIAGAVVLLVLIYLWYQGVYLKGRAEEAASKMYKAEQFVGVDSLSNRAVKGEGGYPGLEQIAKEYDNTKSANLANLYLGGIYLRKGEYKQAIEALSKYSATGSPVADPLALGLLGDAYSELKDFKQAATYYKKAADKASKFTSPMFLKKLGLVNESQNDFKGAVEAYTKVKTQYPESAEAQLIDAYIARAQEKVK
ncbi:tetratricopeptide repeat protein [Pedobacter riviphilus]|jgi:tetratricopeptide (TPR) repeat protein|uniref:Tetratricopeptide repeat protein n=3 Tax=Pedobacter TaxID=84567 RepID=A0A4Q9HHJ0_9SPHI|nr:MULTISPECIES: tetratricopeptide repeat protein [Pedobacter]MDQ0968124.1 tetratricopeptide (TPR) repeat protein [Flavobacterium sp. W4I14]MBT2560325.1 tetratricopeptide repeat protein [Pedobacter sp. ISL-64]MBT2589305.1 tetratricopeptide repeat protein [Pedobacter sp. ISL-68]QNR84820.1 tetratricopeptide repeat protein [Pedobacter riviphilus]TBO44813.1 tetratricopeptide repeat protein [Pedobacter kyonggii]